MELKLLQSCESSQDRDKEKGGIGGFVAITLQKNAFDLVGW